MRKDSSNTNINQVLLENIRPQYLSFALSISYTVLHGLLYANIMQ